MEKLTILRLWAILVNKNATSEDLKNNYFLEVMDDKVILLTGNKKTGEMFGEEINESNLELFKSQNFFMKCLTSLK